jgi:hypothetical protein
VVAGELYDLLDMYEHEAAQQKLYSMKPAELYMHLALQGEPLGCCSWGFAQLRLVTSV